MLICILMQICLVKIAGGLWGVSDVPYCAGGRGYQLSVVSAALTEGRVSIKAELVSNLTVRTPARTTSRTPVILTLLNKPHLHPLSGCD